ncbi:MAG: arsenate reductase (glutaredoxin) [Acidimicrobiales bacterium]
MDTAVYYNPSCSKCRTVQAILAEKGIEARLVRYLEQAPTRAEIEDLMAKLGIEDPRDMMRTGEACYEQLGLATATADELIEAMMVEPVLIERPIVVRGDRAVIARPAERVNQLL